VNDGLCTTDHGGGCLDCAGVANGTAVLDNCSICVGGTTGKTACVTTGIATANATTSLKIAPQPFDASTTISMEDGSLIESITVISADGSIVYSKSNIQAQEIQIGESLASGLYLVQINSSKGIYVSRIVKK
jgi:hypothetical protein